MYPVVIQSISRLYREPVITNSYSSRGRYSFLSSEITFLSFNVHEIYVKLFQFAFYISQNLF
jgi:hypothetical protein